MIQIADSTICNIYFGVGPDKSGLMSLVQEACDECFFGGFSLSGKVALVTIGSWGIGKAIVVVTHAGRVEEINNRVPEIKDELGRIDILENNASTKSKAGVIMATKVVAQQSAEYNIGVNAIARRLTKTRFSEALCGNPDILQVATMRTPLRCVVEPDDMVGAVIFLASDASSYLTGHMFWL